MDRDLLGRQGYWIFSGRSTLGHTVRIPITVIGFGRGKVKVRARKADGTTAEKFVPEKQLQVRKHYGRKSTIHRCRHDGCPAQFVNPFALDKHQAQKHVPCSCGRWFTETGLSHHLGQVKRRGIEHP